jgi:hypothetical protein
VRSLLTCQTDFYQFMPRATTLLESTHHASRITHHASRITHDVGARRRVRTAALRSDRAARATTTLRATRAQSLRAQSLHAQSLRVA